MFIISEDRIKEIVREEIEKAIEKFEKRYGFEKEPIYGWLSMGYRHSAPNTKKLNALIEYLGLEFCKEEKKENFFKKIKKQKNGNGKN